MARNDEWPDTQRTLGPAFGCLLLAFASIGIGYVGLLWWNTGTILPEEEVDGRPVSAWRKDMLGPDREARKRAAATLIKHEGPESVAGALANTPPGHQWEIAEALVEHGAKAAPGLVQALSNRNSAREASAALKRLGAPAVVALVKEMQHPYPETRVTYLHQLAGMGEPGKAAAADLVAVLNDVDENVRDAALEAINQLDLRDPATASAVERLVLVGTPAVKARAIATLSERQMLGASGAVAACLKDEALREPAAAYLARVGPAALPDLLLAITAGDAKVRKAAIETIGKIGPAAKDVVGVLLQAQDDESEPVRAAATAALALVDPNAGR